MRPSNVRTEDMELPDINILACLDQEASSMSRYNIALILLYLSLI